MSESEVAAAATGGAIAASLRRRDGRGANGSSCFRVAEGVIAFGASASAAVVVFVTAMTPVAAAAGATVTTEFDVRVCAEVSIGVAAMTTEFALPVCD